MGNDQTRAA